LAALAKAISCKSYYKRRLAEYQSNVRQERKPPQSVDFDYPWTSNLPSTNESKSLRWSAISRGAVIKGLSKGVEEETVTNCVAKFSYGVVYNSTHFDPAVHRIEDRYWDGFHSRYQAKDQMQWYLRRVRVTFPTFVVLMDIRTGRLTSLCVLRERTCARLKRSSMSGGAPWRLRRTCGKQGLTPYGTRMRRNPLRDSQMVSLPHLDN
jgi:hypothetical protein